MKMSSIIEKIDSPACINNATNDGKRYKCKKAHRMQKEKCKNNSSPELLNPNDTGSDTLKDTFGNFNSNNSTDVYTNPHLPISSSKKHENSHDICAGMSQFTFLDNDVPSHKDFSLPSSSEASHACCPIIEHSISKVTSDNLKSVCSTEAEYDGFTKNTMFPPEYCQHFIEKTDKEKCSKTENETSNCLNSQTSDAAVEYILYQSELQMPQIMKLITNDLSEPYTIYTYRYFINNWPKLCFLAMCGQECVGVVICKLDYHKKVVKRGYIAMLAVAQGQRKKGIGSNLVVRAIQSMVADDCDEVVLETEITNKAALCLYERLGFVKDKRLFRYYLNGNDALRLKLWLK